MKLFFPEGMAIRMHDPVVSRGNWRRRVAAHCAAVGINQLPDRLFCRRLLRRVPPRVPRVVRVFPTLFAAKQQIMVE